MQHRFEGVIIMKFKILCCILVISIVAVSTITYQYIINKEDDKENNQVLISYHVEIIPDKKNNFTVYVPAYTLSNLSSIDINDDISIIKGNATMIRSSTKYGQAFIITSDSSVSIGINEVYINQLDMEYNDDFWFYDFWLPDLFEPIDERNWYGGRPLLGGFWIYFDNYQSDINATLSINFCEYEKVFYGSTSWLTFSNFNATLSELGWNYIPVEREKSHGDGLQYQPLTENFSGPCCRI